MPDSERIRFVDWMARALHDPQSGYYTRRVRTVGRRGDFSTSASTGPLLGQAIAGWVRRELDADSADVRTVIEVGGGDGALSAAVRDSVGWWTRRRLQWFMVETSAPLRAQQEARLGVQRVRWFTNVEDALRTCGGGALIFHNELLDAFPVRLFQWDASHAAWQEIWLANDAGTWREVLETATVGSGESISLAPSAWGAVPLRDGQRIEVATACREWLRAWAPHWRKGAMLTIDYGDVFPQVYQRQPRGTVRAYLMQQRLAGPPVYENMGRQDVTADVNFTDLIAWGESLGWRTMELVTQREFLLQQVRGLEARSETDSAVSFLMDEHGAGTAFKVLIQRPA
jgi:SAM-dependent MidA family methyltransferase